MSDNRCIPRNEIEAAFVKMPTYNATDSTIDLAEMDVLLKNIGYVCNAAQYEQYCRFWTVLFNSKVYLDVISDIMEVINDIPKILRVYAKACDKNKDGFIQEDEFHVWVDVLMVHDPKCPKVDFDKFVKEADTNKDGRVSMEEGIQWFMKTVFGKSN